MELEEQDKTEEKSGAEEEEDKEKDKEEEEWEKDREEEEKKDEEEEEGEIRTREMTHRKGQIYSLKTFRPRTFLFTFVLSIPMYCCLASTS